MEERKWKIDSWSIRGIWSPRRGGYYASLVNTETGEKKNTSITYSMYEAYKAAKKIIDGIQK